MQLQRWNYKTEKYGPYSIPNKWNCPLYERDMEKKINCTNCGKEMEFGYCFTSQEIHSDIGLGYPVCDECNKKEIELKLKYN